MIVDHLIIAICVYATIMLLVSVKYIFRTPVFKDFTVAGAKNGRAVIMLSLLATIIGGSATLGLLNMALTKGPAIFWWLSLGSLGLVLNSLVFAEKLRSLNAYTLPHVAYILMGKEARWLISLIIVISWLGIIAAQFAALSQLFATFVGFTETSQIIFIGIALVVIVYTACGGQLSVLRTDAIQFTLIFLGLLIPCIYMYLPEKSFGEVYYQGLGIFNTEFSQIDLLKLALLVGSTYCIGPDIFSRIFAAKDGVTAKQSLLLAAFVLFTFAIIMGLMGAWIQVHAQTGQDALTMIKQLSMPWWLTYIFIFALVSALLSSIDTFLMTTATIMEHDIIQGSNITRLRCFIVFFGCLALGIVLLQDQIITLLLASYAIYVPGIVFPLAVVLLNYPRRAVHKGMWLGGVFVGSACGIMAILTDNTFLPFLGIASSLFLSLGAVAYGEFVKSKKLC